MQNLVGFNDIFKEDYLRPIREQINNATILLKRLKRNEEDVGGKHAVVALHTGRNTGVGARADDGILPAPGRQDYDRALYATASNYGRIQITGNVIKASRADRYAFVKAVDSEIKGMVKDMKDDVNRQLHGNRTGTLAVVADVKPVGHATPSATVTVDNSMYFQRGMRIDFVDPAGGGAIRTSVAAQNLTIVGRPTATTIVLSAIPATGAANGDIICRQGNWRLEMMGLGGIVNDTNPWAGEFVGGIDRTVAGNEYWKANVLDNGGAARPLTLDLMQQGFDACEIEAGEVTMMLTSQVVRRKYLALLQARKQFVDTLKFDGGFEAIAYNGKPLFVDRHTLPGRILFLDEGSLEFYRMSDFDWMDDDGSVLSRVADKDAYQATLYLYATLGSNACNNNAVLLDIQ